MSCVKCTQKHFRGIKNCWDQTKMFWTGTVLQDDFGQELAHSLSLPRWTVVWSWVLTYTITPLWQTSIRVGQILVFIVFTYHDPLGLLVTHENCFTICNNKDHSSSFSALVVWWPSMFCQQWAKSPFSPFSLEDVPPNTYQWVCIKATSEAFSHNMWGISSWAGSLVLQTVTMSMTISRCGS